MNTPRIEIICTDYNKVRLEAVNQNLLQNFQRHLQGIVDAFIEAGFNAQLLSARSLQILLQNPTAFLIDASNEHRLQGTIITSYSNVRSKVKAFQAEFQPIKDQLTEADVKFTINGSKAVPLLEGRFQG